MGNPISLLGSARAFARDYARDTMPQTFLWDVVDFVPQIIDTNLTNRGKWFWGSAATGVGAIESGILAVFPGGDQILCQTLGQVGPPAINPHLLKLNQDPATDQSLWTWTDLGETYRSLQNPVQLKNTVVHCDGAGVAVPHLWREGAPAPIPAYASMHHPKYATVWKGALISGGGTGVSGNDEADVVRASITGADLTTAASFDVNAFAATNTRITGLKTLRSMVLIFHPSSIERMRGGPLWNTASGIDGTGLIFDSLSERTGCKDPRTIASWGDYVIFADEHGVHMTDGATIRNITEQGGISHYWRPLYEGANSLAATTFLDYYIITLRHPPTTPLSTEGEALPPFASTLTDRPPVPDPPPPVPRPPVPPIPPDLPPIRPPLPVPSPDTYSHTLVCDLNRKQWFRFTNVNAINFFSGGGTSGMERIWAGFSGYDRLVRIGPMFYPSDGYPQVDDDGTTIIPRIETPWYRMGQEGRKRIRFAYLSYDCRTFDGKNTPVRIGYAIDPQTDATYSTIGILPDTQGYTRHRFALNRAPYGIMFYVEATDEIGVFRIFDLGIEGAPEEKSRV